MAASARLRTSAGLVLALIPLALGGCGDEPSAGVATVPDRAQTPDASLTAAISLPGKLGSLDPVFASTRAGRLVSRQIHEPLVSLTRAPFVSADVLEGPGRILPATGRQSKWRVRLRPGLRFQDGSPLDAGAVRANFTRWLSTGIATKALPGVVAVDSPQPDIVRFQFSVQTPNFPRLISDPRLGLVAPRAIAEADGGRVRGPSIGAGPYELRERAAASVLLGRSPQWWGSNPRFGLGPGVGRLEIGLGAGARTRAGQLLSGSVQIADAMPPGATRRIRRDPLLSTIGPGSGSIGVERSVRGIESLSPRQSLSSLWLTDLP